MNKLNVNSIVRIVSNRRIGTGFVVTGEGLIATCAHVLGPSRPEKALVVFQGSSEQREAVVLAESWRGEEAEDIALLKVSEGLPTGVLPLPLGSSLGTEDHRLTTFGYPNIGEIEGARGTGTILGPVPKINGQPLLQLCSSEITEGFSGAPVWDEVRHRVVGMVVSIVVPDKFGRWDVTAHATPTETLRTVSPDLQLRDICPYRNLESFTEEDAAFFFGRQRVVDLLVENLQNEPRFLAVFGASGSGKSSVVQAGLIPKLRKGILRGSDRWDIIVTRPLDSSFQHHLANLKQTSAPAALVIDQFEDLFVSYDEDACTEVITQLIGLLKQSAHVTLILVMRNDFQGMFLAHGNLAEWLQDRVVNVWPTMKREEVEAIVREPAVAVGWRFEDGLVETIVNDTLEAPRQGRKKTGSTILPLLEFALTELWERRQDGMLTHDAYRRIGGVTGGLTQWANEAYSLFDERLCPLARRIFTNLVHLGDEEQHIADSRRRRALSMLIYTDTDGERRDISDIVEVLVKKRLLVASQDRESGQEIVEIVHDALLWEWGLLKQWIDEDRLFLLWHEDLERRVRAWQVAKRNNPTKRNADKLLWGSDLTDAEKWLKTRSSDLPQVERTFIQDSMDQQKRMSRRRVLIGLTGFAGLVAILGMGAELVVNDYLPKPIRPQHIPYSYRGHTASVNRVTWAPDSKRVASASDDETVQLWEAKTGRLLLTYRGHTDAVESVAWSPDGTRIASATHDQIRVWSVDTGITLSTYQSQSYVSNIAWAPNGKRIVLGTAVSAEVLEASTGRILLTYKGHNPGDNVVADVTSVAWSPDGTRIASVGAYLTVQVWEASTGTLLLTYRGHPPEGSTVAWAPSGKYIALGADRTVQVWEASTGNTITTFKGHTDFVTSVAWAPDGKRIASTSQDGTVKVWEAKTGSILFTYEAFEGNTLAPVTSVAWSPNDAMLVSGSTNTMVQVWDASTWITLLVYKGHSWWVWDVAWSPDGTRVASASRDETVQIWEAKTGNRLLTYTGHAHEPAGITGGATGAVWSPDGKRITSTGYGGMQIWEVSDGRILFKGDGVIAWAPDGTRIASASGGTVRIRDAVTGRTLLTYSNHDGNALSIDWSPDGTRIASASSDGRVYIWDATTGRTLLICSNQSGYVQSVVWSPDGTRIASIEARKKYPDQEDQDTLHIWNTATGNTSLLLKDPTSFVTSIAWSPDGTRIASIEARKKYPDTLHIWNTATGNTSLLLKDPTSFVTSIAWSPSSKYLASASGDGGVYIWDAITGRRTLLLSTYGGMTNSVAWSPDGDHIAAGTNDSVVFVWLVLQG